MRECALRAYVLAALTCLLVGTTRGQEQGPLPATPEKLVELLVAENLPRQAGNRGISLTLASRSAGALIEMGDKAVPALTAGLDSKNPLLRLNVAYVLSHIDSPAALAARLRAARDADATVRALAISSLPVYTSREAHQLAWAALSDGSAEVQEAAMRAFVAKPRDGRSHGIEKYYAAQKIAPLLTNKELRPMAAWALGHLGSNVAAGALLDAMDDARREVRYEILESLRKIGDKQTTVGITRHLKDPELVVRVAASGALGELRDLRATAALVAALADPEPAVRRSAADALGRISDWRSTGPLVKLLDDPDESVRRSSAKALGEIGDGQAVPALIKALPGHADSAEAVAAALGQLRDPRAIAALGAYLEKNLDSNIAAQALAKIRHPDAVAELARIASTIKSIEARRGLRAIADVGFDFDPPETVAQWWKEHREEFLRPLPP